jgi:hypothetical protein
MIEVQIPKKSFVSSLITLISLILALEVSAQSVDLTDLSAFKSPGKSWRVAGRIGADLKKNNAFNVQPGNGILVNISDEKNHGADLYTKAEYGDLDVEFDYMMAKGSNSGIYLQGMYEVQLEDTWGKKQITFGNNGGIYERWDDSQPQGKKGYEGFTPRQNVSRAPGLWQHMKISFQAPLFDAENNKIQDAKILKVELNGVLVHENVVLSGPTRGAMSKDEKKTGPLRIQGDHGTVGFRNISITHFENGRPAETPPVTRRQAPVYPIFVNATQAPVFRSFMDLPDGQRVVHTVSVASEEKVHYTYDMDTGMILQVWRGDFLDATPMWHSRGDGSSRPLGTVQSFGKPALVVSSHEPGQAAWRNDTTGTGFRPKGYSLDARGNPTFSYQIEGMIVSDAALALPNGEGIGREITINKPSQNTHIRLAEGTTIVEQEKGMYVVDGNAYYLRIDDVGGATPLIRKINGKQELIVRVQGKVKYSILF